MLKERKIVNEFHQEIRYKESLEKIGKLDKQLSLIRKNKKEVKEISDRQILGEYIDRIRAGMGYDNQDLSNGVETKECLIEGVKCRIYESSIKESPCIIMIHGGAFIGGSIDVVENPCRLLAQLIQGKVISIDYSLAPEKAYPYSLEECQRVCAFIHSHKEEMNISDIYVMGDSAGGNLAIGVSDCNQWIKGFILYYPVTDLSYDVYNKYFDESLYDIDNDLEAKKCVHSLEHSEKLMKKLYLQNYKNVKDPLVSPIYRQDQIKGLLISAEYDYLRIQGEYFASLHQMEVIRYGNVNHAFLDKLGDLYQAQDSLEEVARWIERNKDVEF